MSKEWAEQVAAAEAEAQRHQAAEELAEHRFQAVKAEQDAAGKQAEVTHTEEFRSWLAARHATDAAWGAWAMAMDAKPGS
jgi:hypothetical protein